MNKYNVAMSVAVSVEAMTVEEAEHEARMLVYAQMDTPLGVVENAVEVTQVRPDFWVEDYDKFFHMLHGGALAATLWKER